MVYAARFNTKEEFNKSKAKPWVMPVNPDGIPNSLKQIDRWIGWRLDNAKGTWDKVPVNVKTFRLASSKDAETWATFSQALAAYRRPGLKLDGIGFVLDGTDNLVGLDWDECRTTDGNENMDVMSDIAKLDSYTELSPSAQGYRMFIVADPATVARFNRQIGR